MFLSSYKNKRVFITGHTGFKGSWLSLWLARHGATVHGYSLPAPTDPAHFELLQLDMETTTGDIRDLETLKKAINQFKPDILFHLAAQPLVRQSYTDPLETFATNVMGTANVLEACRTAPNLQAIVNVTSDKCYENYERDEPYSESDRMGGRDPYSASKGCAELVHAAYEKSFFEGQKDLPLLASVRSGNVIGGGDWGADRLIPDLVRATQTNQQVELRNPQAIRPWQFVLEPLTGYLMLGEKLMSGESTYTGPWNFGPIEENIPTVEEVAQTMQNTWSKVDYVSAPSSENPHEAKILKLDPQKAMTQLNWTSMLSFQGAITKTANWYQAYYEQSSLLSETQIQEYEAFLAKGSAADNSQHEQVA